MKTHACVQEIAEKFNRARSILVTSHRGIDGDSAGGALALIRAGRAMGKDVRYLNSEPIPEWLSFFPDISELSAKIDDEQTFDLGIVIDTSTPDRVGQVWPRFRNVPTVVIDHHTPGEIATCSKLCWLDPSAASVTIMIAELFDEAGVDLTKEIALPLYVGLFTDTHSFQQSNTDVRAHEWAKRFVAAGVRPAEVAQAILEDQPFVNLKFKGRATDRAVVEDGICWSVVYRRDYEELDADEGATEGIIGMLRSVRGIRVAVVFKEAEDGKVKVNFRAKDATDVAAVAARFGGGGHRAAAGCTIAGSVEEVRPKILAALNS